MKNLISPLVLNYCYRILKWKNLGLCKNFILILLYHRLAPAIFWALYWGRGYNALCVLGRVMGDRGHNGHSPLTVPFAVELLWQCIADHSLGRVYTSPSIHNSRQ